MTQPTADDLALAREIYDREVALPKAPMSGSIDRIASLIAKHRQPPPVPVMTQEEVYAEIERVLNCTVKHLYDVPGRQSPPGWEVALRKILDDIRVAARVENREFRLKSIDQLVATIIASKRPTQ